MHKSPPESALLSAVELLMGQFSEQILALLEAHARGDVSAEAFEARIRDLMAAVAPQALARHPGRLVAVRPAAPAASAGAAGQGPPLSAPQSAPAALAPRPEAAAREAAPALLPKAAPAPESWPIAAAPEPEIPVILDGVSGFDELPGTPRPAQPSPPAAPKPFPQAAPRPSPPVAPKPAAPAPLSPGPGAGPGQPRSGPAKPLPKAGPLPAAGDQAPPLPPPRPRPGGVGNVVVSGRLATDDLKPAHQAGSDFAAGMFRSARQQEERDEDPDTSFVSQQVRQGIREKSTFKSPPKAVLLSAILPGVGDFYVGNVATGAVFYVAFYILLVLLILRGDWLLLLALLPLSITSAGVSWLNAQKHNEAVHRMQEAPSLRRQTRETTFTYDHTRRRR